MVLDRQKKTLIIALLTVIVLVSLVQLFFSLSSPKVLEEKVYFAKGEIGTKTGFAVNNTAADFGRIPRFSASQKTISIANDYDDKVTVVVSVSGNIRDLIEVRPDHFVLESKESQTITMQFSSSNYSYGNYSGYIFVKLIS